MFITALHKETGWTISENGEWISTKFGVGTYNKFVKRIYFWLLRNFGFHDWL